MRIVNWGSVHLGRLALGASVTIASPSFVLSRKAIDLQTTQYSVVFHNVGPIIGQQLLVDPMSVLVTFNDVVLTRAWTLGVGVTPYGLTLNDVTLVRGRVLHSDVTPYTVTLNDVVFTTPNHLTINTTTYAVTFHDVILLAICHARS